MKRKHSGSVADTERPDVLRIIRTGEEEHIDRLYDMYREEFIAFAARHFSSDPNDAIDVYQESFIALWENIKSGRLETLTVSLKTYLFRIARNKMLNRRRNTTGRNEPLPENITIEESDWVARQEITYELVQQMEEPCNTVLTLYYWERRNMVQIAGAMNYASPQVAKNRKSICMRKLKDVLTKRFTAEGIM